MKLKKVKVRCAAADRELFILRPVTFPKVTVEQLAGDIANATSLTKSDVLSALHCMGELMSERLANGAICDLGELGILRIILRARAQNVDGGKYDIRNNLKYLRYQFTPRGELKDVKKAIRKNAERIEGVSTSRLTEEVAKIIMSGSSAAIFANLAKYGLLQFILPCFSMYMEYSEVTRALDEADRKVREGRDSGNPLAKDEVFAIILRPLIIFPDTASSSPEELFREGFRQAKVLISPMTPPNYELEKAVDAILADMGVRRARKSAEARAPRKKPNTMGRKRAAEEVLSSAASERRMSKRKKVKAARLENTAASLAEAHDA